MNSIGEIIRKYRKQAHYTQPVLAEKLAECGVRISYQGISSWEKGLTEPNASTFMQLCRILNIPDCVEEFFGYNRADPMAKLNDAGKELVRQYIDILAAPTSYVKEKPSLYLVSEPVEKKIRLYDLRVSAGTGNFADSDAYTVISVDSRKAKGADFAVTITGDSMMPRFVDHQMVFVHSQDTLEDGEIGIFSYEDNVYIKKLQDTTDGVKLISLNPKYAPISIDPSQESFRIFGKVCG